MPTKKSLAEAPPTLARGSTVVPGYEIREHLSRGRAIDVYDAWSEDRGCLCIVKTLRPDRLGDRTARRRLGVEAALLLTLTHPHIVRAYELVHRPQPALILETLTGSTLTYILKTRTRRLPTGELAVLGLQLASAIAYIHRNGFLHLDLKPSNVVCDGGLAKLIDLSIARAPGYARKPIGTRVYMSPEQARGGQLTQAADVWGLGGVLYESATGQRPFKGADGTGCPQLDRRAEPVRSRRRLPPELADAIDACLEPDPAARPSLANLTCLLQPFAGA